MPKWSYSVNGSWCIWHVGTQGTDIDAAPVRAIEKDGVDRMEENGYRRVVPGEYVREGLADGRLEVFEAVKNAYITAVKAREGQKVLSWSEDENGDPVLEKVITVCADEETGETGWTATKIDADGNPVVDRNGHQNQWVIDDETFHEKYEACKEQPGRFKPVDGIQRFVETKEPLIISQWGEEMKMPEGSFINVTDPEDMYAINPRDFNDTYTRIGQDRK